MKDITVHVVPHTEQAYDAVGDWRFAEDDTLAVTVSDLGDPRYNALVALHEIVEALLCQERGIPEEAVTQFDTDHPELEEPGEDPTAPYHKEHLTASLIEYRAAGLFGIDWESIPSRLPSYRSGPVDPVREVIIARYPSPLGTVAIVRWRGPCGKLHRVSPDRISCAACLDAA